MTTGIEITFESLGTQNRRTRRWRRHQISMLHCFAPGYEKNQRWPV